MSSIALKISEGINATKGFVASLPQVASDSVKNARVLTASIQVAYNVISKNVDKANLTLLFTSLGIASTTAVVGIAAGVKAIKTPDTKKKLALMAVSGLALAYSVYEFASLAMGMSHDANLYCGVKLENGQAAHARLTRNFGDSVDYCHMSSVGEERCRTNFAEVAALQDAFRAEGCDVVTGVTSFSQS